MLSNIIDTHAHYNDRAFDSDRNDVLASLRGAGIVCVINCGTDLASSVQSRELAEQFDFVYFAAGIHPEDCGNAQEEDLAKIQTLLRHEKCVAVGEIGLDHYWPEPPHDVQNLFFERQLALANDCKMPVIIHDREAHGDTMALMRRYRPAGVLHCFSGSVETMFEAVSLGLYIGLGGAVTFKNAKKAVDVAKAVPADRLLLETDCPYMAPTPFRGKRNSSALIPYTAEFIAGLRGVDAQTLIDQTTENAKRLFF
ncbi:MAG: TatD family hydrolase [Clostridia bacterium]|nr:TatD family hydrolase [Clostridia bacterium]